MKTFVLLVAVVVSLFCLFGLAELSVQQETQTQPHEALDTVLKDTRSSLLEIANALVELEVSIKALEDAKVPDLVSIKMKKDHQEEMLKIQGNLQGQLNSFEEKAGYKAGSASCEAIASQLKGSMKEGNYWIFPVHKPIRVRCKIIKNVWSAISISGLATKPDLIVGPNPNTGIFSADGSEVGISINGVETVTTNKAGLKVKGKLEASHIDVSGQSLFQKVFTFENRLDFTRGQWFPLIGGKVTNNLPDGTYLCRTSWDGRANGYWFMDHSYLMSWISHTNTWISLSTFPIPVATGTHHADSASVELRFRPLSGQVPPVVEMKIDASSKGDGKGILFKTRCLHVFSD